MRTYQWNQGTIEEDLTKKTKEQNSLNSVVLFAIKNIFMGFAYDHLDFFALLWRRVHFLVTLLYV